MEVKWQPYKPANDDGLLAWLSGRIPTQMNCEEACVLALMFACRADRGVKLIEMPAFLAALAVAADEGADLLVGRLLALQSGVPLAPSGLDEEWLNGPVPPAVSPGAVISCFGGSHAVVVSKVVSRGGRVPRLGDTLVFELDSGSDGFAEVPLSRIVERFLLPTPERPATQRAYFKPPRTPAAPFTPDKMLLEYDKGVVEYFAEYKDKMFTPIYNLLRAAVSAGGMTSSQTNSFYDDADAVKEVEARAARNFDDGTPEGLGRYLREFSMMERLRRLLGRHDSMLSSRFLCIPARAILANLHAL